MPQLILFFDLADEISSIGEKLIPNWMAFLVQLISLIVLLVIIFFIAYKPVKNMLEKRADYIEQEVKDAEESKLIAQKNAEESAKMITESKKQASEIIDAANKRALVEAEEIKEETRLEISRMKKAADKEIEEAKAQSLKDIHTEMVNVALSASEEILGREVDKRDNEKLARDFINNLEN